ncbi:MAG TPA: excinuclease ABC subunit UvrA [Thermotogaceae bacterium]|nr:excinuclease ABC subunit UvrA [Thermotogaceae bacterium]
MSKNSDFIHIKGARVHNLKNINLKIPRNKLIVITGLSGSGKSSLAFDTIYAEGQRRYLESLSSYARQFLGELKKPDVEEITGLSPAIAIQQKTVSHNPRSTVGTVTEIYDYLRLLYARIGKAHCPNCGRPLQKQSIDEIIQNISSNFSENSRIYVFAPLVFEKKGEFKKELSHLRSKGYLRVEIDGNLFSLEDDDISLDKNVRHTIKLLIDRMKLTKENLYRLTDAVEIALKETSGLVEIRDIEDEKSELFSEKLSCPICGINLPEITPKLFSFNSPYGACPKCSGLGFTMEFSPDLMINEELSIKEGAIIPYRGVDNYTFQMIKTVVEHYGGSVDVPFKSLPPKVKNVILYGTTEKIKRRYEFENGSYEVSKPFEGVVNNIIRRYRETQSEDVKRWIENNFVIKKTCTECNGKRLRKEALAVKVGDLDIAQLTQLTVKDAYQFIESLKLTEKEQRIVSEVLKEIKRRLKFLIDVGLDYLTLSRNASTLSGGESQRIRLATQIGSKLVGVLYVLDEPTIGLHQRDNTRLINTLKELRDLGNTVIVVEHDKQVIENADYIVDIGPGGGVNGGKVVYSGDVRSLVEDPKDSLTGMYLKGIKQIPLREDRRKGNGKFLTIKGVKHNNLKNITVKFPLGTLICVTGVSGSGKSSLITETLYPALKNHFYRTHLPVGKFKKIEGLENIDKVIAIDQSPIGRTPRSNPATYTKVFDHIRELFAMTPEARARGYKKGRFSFNVKGGRCEACQGQGTIKIEMHFLPDVYVECDVCKGKRYNKETLEVKYKGKSIADVLDMTVDEASEFFKNIGAISHILKLLQDVGLGYIKLGQPATTLSGGEAQRIKLTSELRKVATGNTLYILDEPTTGLHFEDVKKLLDVLNRLVDKGNTVIVIEHNLDVIKNADYIIDLGPEGGDNGGEIVVSGTPEEVSNCEKSYTGKYLKELLEQELNFSLERGE